MNRFLKSTATRVFAAVLAMLLLGGLLPLLSRGNTSIVTSAVGLVTSPLQGLSMQLSHAVRDFTSHFESSAELRSQLEAREAEIAALHERLLNYHAAIERATLLEEFLDIKTENPDFRFTPPTTIIGIERIGDSIVEFTLNRGTTSGIRADHPVLMGQYLVGVVAEAGLTTSTVHTILHPRVNIAVYETLTNEIGVANAPPTLAAQGLTAIPQLDRTTAIAPGYLIATSGLGGIFPRNLILGIVDHLTDCEQGLTLTAVIEPAVNLNNLRNVLVLIEQ